MIIPVYNVEKYLSEAIQSALHQAEVDEVVLIEDGSPDHSIDICREYVKNDSRVKLFTHENRKNLGAGASRNLGMDKSTSEYISFLDADDFYLPNRFKDSIPILERDQNVDGVHELVGVHYQNSESKKFFDSEFSSDWTGINRKVAPDDLFRSLAFDKYGYIHLNALTLRRSSIPEGCRFIVQLKQCQDSEFILRLAKFLQLKNGNLSAPVALRRVHGENRIFDRSESLLYARMFGYKIIENDFYGESHIGTRIALLMKIVRTFPIYRAFRRSGSKTKMFLGGILILFFLLTHPSILWKVIRNHNR